MIKMNNSVMKCCICNNEKSGEFITINGKKYHLCCIKQLQNNWNELKKYISAEWYCFDNESVEFEVARKIMKKAQELEQGKDE